MSPVARIVGALAAILLLAAMFACDDVTPPGPPTGGVSAEELSQ